MTIHQILANSDARFDKQVTESRIYFDRQLAEFHAKFADKFADREQLRIADNARCEKLILEVENRFEKALNHFTYKIVGIIGGIVVITGALASLLHHFT